MKRLIVVCATCGVGKSTVVGNLEKTSLTKDYICVDDVLNWHEYMDLPNGGMLYYRDSINKVVKLSGEKNIIWATCMNPNTYQELDANDLISDTKFINLICDDITLSKRLKGRPKERMTHSDEFIETQVEYMNWFKKNSHLMDMVVDSTNQSIDETTEVVRSFIGQLS